MTNGFVLRMVAGPESGASTQVDVPVVVGREGDFVIRDPTVSRRHWRVESHSDRLWLTDLDSAAGTTVNGRPARDCELHAGDVITFGASVVKVLRLFRYPDVASGPAVLIRDGGRDRSLPVRAGTTVGREPTCDIQIDDPSVSRKHAVFRLASGRVELEDLQTPNGTRVGGRPVRGSVVLAEGQRIELGTATMQMTYTEGRVTRVRFQSVSRRSSVGTARPSSSMQARRRRWRTSRPRSLVFCPFPTPTCSCTDARTVFCFIPMIDGARSVPVPVTNTWSLAVMHRLSKRRVLGSLCATTPHSINFRCTEWPEPAFVVARVDPPETTSFRGRGILWQVGGGLGAVVIGLTLAVVNPDYAVFGLITGGIGIVSITASIFGGAIAATTPRH